jgi:hypothetical protein
MEKLYLGVDLHKRSCWVTVLDADGGLLESQRLGTEKWELQEYFGKVRKPAAGVARGRKLAGSRQGSGAHLGWRRVRASTLTV